MILVNIDQLSDSELRYIAQQENLNRWETLSKEELIDELMDLYDSDNADGLSTDKNRKFVKTLTATDSSDVLQLPGVTPLPDFSSETEIHCVQRNANWVYVYWSYSSDFLKNEKRRQFSFALRVVALPEENKNREFYEIDINESDLYWSVELPWKGRRYNFELVYKNGAEVEVLACSETVTYAQSWIEANKEILCDKEKYEILVPSLVSKGGQPVNVKQVVEILGSLDRSSK